MKLYLTSERHALLPALCLSTAPTASRQWQDSALAPAALVPTARVAGVTGVPAALVPTARVAGVTGVPAALVPAALVAGATGSARVDLAVRETEPAEIRTDVTTDEIHVASAALLDQRGIRVQGTTGFSAKHDDMTAPKPNGGVRGIPPRGRPV
ncbi:hypothetical protein ACPPVO_05395 [Dactylosporangium sp. McL0621]|uniref:hypothetical protein n=1 Tax=Dactylosporangium sp. McL0621 TaxID=3415678 RepID=UPI003CE7116E